MMTRIDRATPTRALSLTMRTLAPTFEPRFLDHLPEDTSYVVRVQLRADLRGEHEIVLLPLLARRFAPPALARGLRLSGRSRARRRGSSDGGLCGLCPL